MDSRILFIIFLCIFIIVISLFKVENFAVTTRSIIAEDEISNEEYHKCINENDMLNYKTKGTYNSCNNILNNLTNWGLKSNTNLGFGKFDDMCSFSSMKKIPSDCLEKHIKNQDKTIKDIHNLFLDSGTNEIFLKDNFNKNINIHQKYINELYKNPEINDAIDYLYLYSYPVSDNIYNSILNEKKSNKIGGGSGSTNNNIIDKTSSSNSPAKSYSGKTSEKPIISPTRFKKVSGGETGKNNNVSNGSVSNGNVANGGTTSSRANITEPSLTPPAIIFNTSNMNLEKNKNKYNNTTAVLGY
jgi:hypothetical protein